MTNKPEYNEQAVTKQFAKNLGTTHQDFDLGNRNPQNDEILMSMEHNDIWGAEARLFSTCFQEVRNVFGPYKIFGSFENEMVSSCVHQHVDAWKRTLRNLGYEQ